MPELTDPALELAELCDRLAVSSNERGDLFLAKAFNVDPWSAEFFQIAQSIVNRTEAVEQLLVSINTKKAVVDGAKVHLARIRQAFDLSSLSSHWSQIGLAHVRSEHSSPIRMLSGAIPDAYGYPKLTTDEANDVIELVDQLLKWLRDAQLSEKDFIRESLIEGLEQFRFRMEHLQWFGWGYSIQSLRDVITAYLILERGLNPKANPDVAAAAKKLCAALKKIFGYASTAKDVGDTGDWLLSCYRHAVRTAAGPALGYIAGLLTH